MNTIKFQVTKGPKVKGILLIMIAICLEAAAIPGFAGEGTAGIIAIVILSLVFVIPMIINGVLNIISYSSTEKLMKSKVKLYGEVALRSQIQFATETFYHSNYGTFSGTTYFTHSLIIAPKSGIVDYNEIDLISIGGYTHKGYVIQHLELCLYDGSVVIVASCAKEEQLNEFIRLCKWHNPNMMVGNSAENSEKHSKNVEAYEKGMIRIPQLQIEVLTQPMGQQLS